MVGRGNAGPTTSKSGHPCPSQKSSQWSPAEKSGKESLLNRPSCPPYDPVGQGTELVSWCFKPSQPQRSISGLRQNFIKRYVVERTNKAEIRPEEQSKKAESCREKLWNGIQHKDRNKPNNRIKRSGHARLVYVFVINRNIPTTSG